MLDQGIWPSVVCFSGGWTKPSQFWMHFETDVSFIWDSLEWIDWGDWCRYHAGMGKFIPEVTYNYLLQSMIRSQPKMERRFWIFLRLGFIPEKFVPFTHLELQTQDLLDVWPTPTQASRGCVSAHDAEPRPQTVLTKTGGYLYNWWCIS